MHYGNSKFRWRRTEVQMARPSHTRDHLSSMVYGHARSPRNEPWIVIVNHEWPLSTATACVYVVCAVVHFGLGSGTSRSICHLLKWVMDNKNIEYLVSYIVHYWSCISIIIGRCLALTILLIKPEIPRQVSGLCTNASSYYYWYH